MCVCVFLFVYSFTFFEIWLNWKSVQMFSWGARSIVSWLQLNASCSFKSVVNMTQFSCMWVISQKSLIQFFLFDNKPTFKTPAAGFSYFLMFSFAFVHFVCTQNVYILTIFLFLYCCRFDLFCFVETVHFLWIFFLFIVLFCCFFFFKFCLKTAWYKLNNTFV